MVLQTQLNPELLFFVENPWSAIGDFAMVQVQDHKTSGVAQNTVMIHLSGHVCSGSIFPD